jgi:Asp-tRNA(Asn)/Glu-tRNA(Gln) amidotransferase A subunit family amidase
MMLSVLDLVRRLDAGEIKPHAVVDLCAEAIAAREPEIGAFVALDIEAARKAADDPQLRSAPLRGLPIGVKDIYDTADLPTAYGSPIYKDYRPRADASAVALARRAGGVVLGKTATTEFASLVPAGTRNPRNLAHTPGGSSSGSAAAVAAAMLPIAFGSQTAGSVVRPAAFCGVAGFKPSYRLIPTVGMKCYAWHLDTVGLFAANVADVAYAAAAISERPLRVDEKTPAAPRIGLVRTHLWSKASAAMQGAIDQTVRAAEANGATVTELELPEIMQQAFRAQFVIQDFEAFRSLAFEYDNHRDQIGAPLREQLDRAASIAVEDYDAARRTASRARQSLGEFMRDVDVILTPSAPGAAPRGFGFTGDPVFNRLWTLMGTPCVNVPGLSEGDLPLGVQIVGDFGRDRQTLEAALFVERALAGKS